MFTVNYLCDLLVLVVDELEVAVVEAEVVEQLLVLVAVVNIPLLAESFRKS